MRLALGFEDGMPALEKNRALLGEYHLVAIYERALLAAEVRENFAAGPRPGLKKNGE